MKRTLMALGLALLAGAPAVAQEYPSRPVRIVVPFAPGGVVDIAARQVSQQLSLLWKQSVVVDNKAGGNGFIATTAVARSVPDGYTLLMAHTGEFAVNPAIFKDIPYELERDFIPVTLVSDTPLAIAVGAASPFNTVADFIAQGKKDPGSLTFSSPGTGSYNHLVGEWFATSAGIKLMHVPYRGGSPAAAAVASGEVAMGVVSISSIDQFVKTGRVKVLALTTKRKIASRPELKTLQSEGVADVDAANWVGLFAPKGTPPAVVEKINRDVVALLKGKVLQESFAQGGGEAVGSTSKEFEERIKRDLEMNRAVVKKAGVKVD